MLYCLNIYITYIQHKCNHLAHYTRKLKQHLDEFIHFNYIISYTLDYIYNH